MPTRPKPRDDELTAGLRANRDAILTEVFARMADYVRLELLEHRP